MNAYKRLTKQGGLNFANKNLSLVDEWGYSHIYNRLAELEDKIEQGTLKEIPEGAVVVSRQIWEEHIENWDKTTKAVEERARKETAEKLLNKVDYESNGQTKAITDLLRKEYGVETK